MNNTINIYELPKNATITGEDYVFAIDKNENLSDEPAKLVRVAEITKDKINTIDKNRQDELVLSSADGNLELSGKKIGSVMFKTEGNDSILATEQGVKNAISSSLESIELKNTLFYQEEQPSEVNEYIWIKPSKRYVISSTEDNTVFAITSDGKQIITSDSLITKVLKN